MASQGQGFVCLLATAADGRHEPQLFRMRWDQPLRRFARAYAVFRELGPEAEVRLRMMTASHGELDPAATAGAYGLIDGDQVVFTEAQLAPEPAEAEVVDPDAEKALVPAEAAGSREAPAAAAPSEGAEAPAAAEAEPQGRRGRASTRAHGGKAASSGRGRSAAGGRQSTSSSSQAPRSAGEAPADASAAESSGASSKAKAKVKAKTKATAPASAKAKSQAKAKASAKAEGRQAKAKAKAKAQPLSPVTKDTSKLLGEPSVHRGLMRATTVKYGPAKGWRVMAWLHSGRQSGSHDNVVRWRALSPGRTHAFSTFRSTRDGRGLQDHVSEGVFTHIYNCVRPQLLRRISDRRNAIENRTPKPKRRRSSSSDDRTPAPLPAPSSTLATQPFLGAPVVEKPWEGCACEAHLRRHPRCIFAGHMQPPLVHLKDYMLIGRGDQCDLVLDSRRTPQMISRCHAVLHREEGGYYLVDQGSMNGVLVNEQPVTGKRLLVNGDVITFGVPMPHPELDYVFETRPDLPAVTMDLM